MSLNLKVPLIKTRTPSPSLFRRPHSRSNPKPLSEFPVRGRKRSNTVHFDYGTQQYEELKALDIQRRFPSDDLRLNKSLDTQVGLLAAGLNHRRRSSPARVIIKLQEKLSKSSTNLNAELSPRSARSPTPDEGSPNVPRNFIREGAVCLSTGVSSLNRYMILYSDLLLIAKPKSGASLKLKVRLPVSELWLQSAIDGVSESNVTANKSFVIGWPTVSYVATFSSTEDKTLWWNVLKKTIDEQRAIDCGKTLPIRILHRDLSQKNSAPLSLPVSNEDDVKSVVKMALQGFGIASSDANDFQLWVVSGKENAAYPLMGHEIPFCIKMNHIRQAGCNLDSPVFDQNELNQDQASPRSKCEFILKKKKNLTSRLDVDSPNSQKRWKSPMKSPIINWALHKKPQKQNSVEERAPQGSFFGLPLGQVATDEEQLPTPVQDMLMELFRRGPSTVGIFRKSALMKSVKQLRQDLDEGKIVSFGEKSALVIATVFKEFLRGLPTCAFGSEFLNEMLETKEIIDPTERTAEIDKNLNKLPKLNLILIKKFFCVLYHIARLSETNKMTSQNLAICIAPSLVWSSKTLVPSSPRETTSACELVQFVIDNFKSIFGEDATGILGDESEIQPPISYDDEEMPDQNVETLDADSPRQLSDEFRAKKAEFTLSLRVPDFSISPDFSPTSPENERKSSTTRRLNNGCHITNDLKKENRRHSENDLTDLNDNYPSRKLRARAPLASYTATAELIKHHAAGEVETNESSSTVIRIVSTTKENSPPTNTRRKNSPSNHAIYHRKVRPTPTYEEAMRQLRRNAQFSPTFMRKCDGSLDSSEESIDLKSDQKYQNFPKTQKSEVILRANKEPGQKMTTEVSSFSVNSQKTDSPISPITNRKVLREKPRMKLEKQKFSYHIGSPTSDRLKSRCTAEDFRRRAPEEILTNSGQLRNPISPSSYEEHLQRRKRFEKAYLQKINLDLNESEKVRTAKGLKVNYEFCKGVDFMHSYNGADCEKTSRINHQKLSSSFDSAGLKSLRARSNSDQDSIPLSNGIQTFVTQIRTSNGTPPVVKTSIKEPYIGNHKALKSTVSTNARIHTPSNDLDSAGKPLSPLRAAIESGTFMYRTEEPTKNHTSIGHLEDNVTLRITASTKQEKNNNNLTPDYTSERPRRLSDRTLEDFDKILAGLKGHSVGSSSSSSVSDSVGELDVPSHEDIKNILCQDESYV